MTFVPPKKKVIRIATRDDYEWLLPRTLGEERVFLRNGWLYFTVNLTMDVHNLVKVVCMAMMFSTLL